MKTTKAERRVLGMLAHGEKLRSLYPNAVDDPLTLCKRLRRLEVEAHHYAEALCNYLDASDEEVEHKASSFRRRARAILGAGGPDIVLDLDPRGYALKIDCSIAKGLDIKHDWAGYGIICPEF
jgi:hypothetical protein